MKILLILMLLTYKCSQLSSAPTATIIDVENDKNNNKSDNWITEKVTSSAYSSSHSPPIGYISDDNGLIFQFRRSIKSDNTEIEARRRSALDKNFMRFGRNDKNMIRFGRDINNNKNSLLYNRKQDDFVDDDTELNNRYVLDYVDSNNNDENEYDGDKINDPLQQGMQKRSPQDHGDVEYLYKNPISGNLLTDVQTDERIENSYETPDNSYLVNDLETNNIKPFEKNIIRFGRPDKNMLRFGKSGDKNMMRFGRSNDKNILRFGRSKEILPRNSRSDKNLMRFGRSFNRPERPDKNMLRFGKRGNLMRFGRNDKNLLRFGKRDPPRYRIFCIDENKCIPEPIDGAYMKSLRDEISKRCDLQNSVIDRNCNYFAQQLQD